MFRFIREVICLALLLTMITSVQSVGAQNNRPQDKEIHQKIVFASGKNSTVIRKQIKLGTSHVYTFSANEGQTLSVRLKTGDKTSLSVYAPVNGVIEDADGVKKWSGALSESGEFTIIVGTDATAKYMLEISIK